jgi:hypothetical protein
LLQADLAAAAKPWVDVPIEAGMLVEGFITFGGWSWAQWLICEICPETPGTYLQKDRIKTRLVALGLGGLDKESGKVHPWQPISSMSDSVEIQVGVGNPQFHNNIACVNHPYDHSVDLTRCTLVVSKSKVRTIEAAMGVSYTHVAQKLAANPLYASWMNKVSLPHNPRSNVNLASQSML